MEISIPTLNDPGLAPEGKHVLSALVQFVPYDLGPDPQAARAKLLQNILSVLENHAPGLGALVEHCELLTPSDIEREFGLAGGHWHQGALSFDQFFINRPLPLYQQYQSPLPGLWMCGAACHPGGSVMGLAGRHAARAILQSRSAP
jgi:phytoene dehydrogenase-like protein